MFSSFPFLIKSKETHFSYIFQVVLDDLQAEKSFNNLKIYGRSKSCNILFALHLAKVLKGEYDS